MYKIVIVCIGCIWSYLTIPNMIVNYCIDEGIINDNLQLTICILGCIAFLYGINELLINHIIQKNCP